VLTDAATQHQPFAGYETIPYHVTPSGGSTDEEGISQWALTDSVTPGIYSLDDYDFRKPNAWLFQARQNPVSPQPGSIDVYDWPGRFVEHDHADFYARIRQERWQVEHQQIHGSATALGIAPGNTFTLYNAPFFSDNAEYLTTEANYWLEENNYASGSGSQTMHRIDFTVIPPRLHTVRRKNQPGRVPMGHRPQSRRPAGESIWTDRYGRVKVKFHWDRLAKGDDTSSCWVRVSSAWAGQGFGGVQMPRVGDEVVVDFINGDPDRPIITGRVYNEASMPPWALPPPPRRWGSSAVRKMVLLTPPTPCVLKIKRGRSRCGSRPNGIWTPTLRMTPRAPSTAITATMSVKTSYYVWRPTRHWSPKGSLWY
jgi:type VI secretion system secreted protein VgrG